MKKSAAFARSRSSRATATPRRSGADQPVRGGGGAPHCRELLERLSLYIDGELKGPQRRTLIAHLRRCPCCGELAESLKRTVQLCHEAGKTRLPPGVRARARARIADLLAEER
jgi:anti-sigma factor RsiW